MREIIFIAWNDAKFQLRQGSTLVWVFVMPPIFFFFIGTVTGGFSSGISGGQATPISVIAEAPGFLQEQIDLRPIAAIQSGNSSIGKKLPPIIIRGKSSIIENRLAPF